MPKNLKWCPRTLSDAKESYMIFCNGKYYLNDTNAMLEHSIRNSNHIRL